MCKGPLEIVTPSPPPPHTHTEKVQGLKGTASINFIHCLCIVDTTFVYHMAKNMFSLQCMLGIPTVCICIIS